MSEFRKDPLSNRWVITLDDKSFVPNTGQAVPEALPAHDVLCPFCTGNEDKTPNSIYTHNDKNGNWNIRVIPNNNPYLKVETQLKKKGESIFDIVSGTGANEIIIEAPEHNLDVDEMDINRVTEIIKAYRARMVDLMKDTRMEYLLIFKNRGIRAGAHLHHSHSQLMAMPVIPKAVEDEITASENYYHFKGRCPFCDTAEAELAAKSRLVKESEYYVCFVPFASRTPFEMWIMPKNHMSHFHSIDDAQARDLAYVLKDAMFRLNKALNYPPYNYMIHTSPAKLGEMPYYHWHLEILPRVKSIAGFEWGSGFHINPTLPEEAAEYLRKI